MGVEMVTADFDRVIYVRRMSDPVLARMCLFAASQTSSMRLMHPGLVAVQCSSHSARLIGCSSKEENAATTPVCMQDRTWFKSVGKFPSSELSGVVKFPSSELSGVVLRAPSGRSEHR
eukprot:s1961_g13.t1